MSRADLSNYVTVAERVALFAAKYPEGSLSFEVMDWRDLPGHGPVVIGRAMAHRVPGDPSPGVGWAMEVVPGRTNFTKGSEIQNLETSAWGRAIAALGIAVDRGIASRDEVRAAIARQGVTESDAPPVTVRDLPPTGDERLDAATTRAEVQALIADLPPELHDAARAKWKALLQ